VKYTLLKSGIVNVYMPYSVQIHQDFFVHGIPYFPDGTRVTSKFSGGCLRLADTDAKTVYDFADKNEKIIVFETAIENKDLKDGFYNPIDSNRY
jgi:lipoprotein-anchoring transpeptidase ErfK/SrfK